MRKNGFLICASLAILIISHSAYAYLDVIDLGTLGGDSESCALSINDNGQIVGSSGSYDSVRACLFDPTGGGNNIYLGSLGGGISKAYSINNSGQIVGRAMLSAVGTPYGENHACFFDPTGGGANVDMSGIYEGIAYSINDNGQIVGTAYGGYISKTACIFNSSGYGCDFPPVPLGSTSAAYSVNDNGQIVGVVSFGSLSTQDRAFIFHPTSSGVDLGTLGGTESIASSNNNNGQIVGGADNSSGHRRACIFDPNGGGANINLGSINGYDHSIANSINEIGQIVGWVYNKTGGFPPEEIAHACLFDETGGGANIDLNDLIEPSSGWILEYAYDINNDGWIVGYGTNPNGDEHGYLLVIPEPGTILLITFGGMLIRKRR
ncbi:MAG: PEP-CTERM sorting domain-containing protein [Sedimentisphaerales bacterium]|nr:PEP-CTERM sorting domain-containing protein [Sedimentisphaerales bacterium]